MSHSLYRDTLAFTGQRPWHKLGIQFDQEFTSAQALVAAAMDYEVTKEPVYRILGGQPIQIDGKVATINQANQQVLGIVSDGYEVLQNREAFAFTDVILAEAGGKYITAGALGNGERAWLLAKLPETFTPLVDDTVEQYLLCSTSHDGNYKTEVRFTGIRVICANTLAMAMKESKGVISVKHTTSMREKLEIAAKVLKRYREHFDIFGDRCAALARIRIDDAWLDEYLGRIIGNPLNVPEGRARTLMENRIKLIEGRLAFGKGVDLPGVAGTAWHALNAMVEYADYDMKVRSQAQDETRRTASILFGSAAEFKQNAFDTAMAMVSR